MIIILSSDSIKLTRGKNMHMCFKLHYYNLLLLLACMCICYCTWCVWSVNIHTIPYKTWKIQIGVMYFLFQGFGPRDWIQIFGICGTHLSWRAIALVLCFEYKPENLLKLQKKKICSSEKQASVKQNKNNLFTTRIL